MIMYENFRFEQSISKIKLSADILLFFDKPGEENYEVILPKSWMLPIEHMLMKESLDAYWIYATTILHGMHNRISDYKGVWRLLDVEHGIYDDSYLNKKGKVYLGIKKSTNSVFQTKAPVLIFMPTAVVLDLKLLPSLFREQKFDFDSDCNDKAIDCILNLIPEAIIVHTCLSEKLSMTIYGHDLDKHLCHDVIQTWSSLEETQK